MDRTYIEAWRIVLEQGDNIASVESPRRSLREATWGATQAATNNEQPYVVSRDNNGRYTVLSFDFHHCHESEYGLTPIVTVFPGATPLPRQIID